MADYLSKRRYACVMKTMKTVETVASMFRQYHQYHKSITREHAIPRDLRLAPFCENILDVFDRQFILNMKTKIVFDVSHVNVPSFLRLRDLCFASLSYCCILVTSNQLDELFVVMGQSTEPLSFFISAAEKRIVFDNEQRFKTLLTVLGVATLCVMVMDYCK